MRTETNGHSHEEIDASLGYEARDVSLRTLVKWIVGLYIFIFLTVAGTIPLYFLMVPKAQTAAPTMRQPTVKRALPEPVIQSHPVADMKQFQRDQELQASSYGLIAGQPGKARIPVEVAIDKVLASGLPVKEQSGPAPSGIHTATDTTAAWTASQIQNSGSMPTDAVMPTGPGPAALRQMPGRATDHQTPQPPGPGGVHTPAPQPDVPRQQ